MLFVLIMFLVALSIAGVAAFFSITGLVAIFSASAISVVIMGSVLEVGKLVAISYTYRYWPLIGFLQKVAMLFFIVLLMIITSIGIFGFLSKAHLEKIGPQDQYVLQIERIDKKIESENAKIERNQRVLDNLDSALDKYIELGYVTRGLEQREEQAEQRGMLEGAIHESENKLNTYNDERSELTSMIQDIELEVGPIKYVAQLIYGDSDQGLEMAVKLLIIMLVCTFDPLAVSLLVAANHASMNRKDRRVRSEFGILKGEDEIIDSDPIQNKSMGYDNLSPEEKQEQCRKVKEYLETLERDSEDDEDLASTRDKYQDILNDENNIDSGTEVGVSPYRLNRIDDGPENADDPQEPDKSVEPPELQNVWGEKYESPSEKKKASQKGKRFNWLPRRNPPKE